jgi:hypothetical protein
VLTNHIRHVRDKQSGFGGLAVSLLASCTQVRGFKPGLSLRIFRGDKILSMSSFGGEVKPPVPYRRFGHVKEPSNYVEVGLSGQI